MKLGSKGWLRIGQGVLMTVVLVLVTYQIYLNNRTVKKILIVHSYNTDFPWVNDIDNGINRSLKKLNYKVHLRHHYMNLLNHPDCNYYRLAGADARIAVQDWKPDILVLVDDLAQALIGFQHLDWKPDANVEEIRQGIVNQVAGVRCPEQDATFFGLDKLAPAGGSPIIFFAGVNGDVTRYGYEQASNVSGIFERKNFEALAETLNTINASLPSKAVAVQLLNDYSSTAISENAQYARRNWGSLRWLPPKNMNTFDEWKQAVVRASADQAILLIANYQNLSDGRGGLVPAKEVIAWTERNSVYPALGAATNFVADGGMMTVAISGVEQGEVVMLMMKHYFETGQILPAREARQFLVGLNQSLIRKRQLKLPSVYEAFSREMGTFVDVSEQIYYNATTEKKP